MIVRNQLGIDLNGSTCIQDYKSPAVTSFVSWYAAMTDPDITEIFGAFDMAEFTW